MADRHLFDITHQILYRFFNSKLFIFLIRPIGFKRDSLSIPMDSKAVLRATTSKSENFGTTSHLGKFPRAFTKLSAICLQMSRYFANIAYRLCI